MKARIVNSEIEFKNSRIAIDSLYDNAYYEISNGEAPRYINDTYGVNEVFNNLIQPYLAVKKWIDDNHPSRLDVRNAEIRCRFYAKDICNHGGSFVEGVSLIDKIIVWTTYQFSTLLETIYFMFLQCKIRKTDEIHVAEKFAVLRHKGSIKKFKRFGEISQEIESLYDKGSIYRLFSLSRRLNWLIKAYFSSFKTMKEMRMFYLPLLGDNFKYPLMDFYRQRIVYAEFYKLMLDDYFSHFAGKSFYTGNNLDRFSVIEDQVARKYNIKTYNIPHGIEYGFRFPTGFSSDVFYTHSQYTADFLNKMYSTSKYVFEPDVIKRMFDYHYDKPHEKMIIFFTEPREVNVNIEIVNGLLPKLEAKGKKLYLKLHPGDNRSNYEGMDVDYIKDYELSLTGNICISRKSTILLEAIYNQSLPIAIITNVKDQTMFDLFPSLNAKEIVKTYSVDELYGVIKDNI